MKVTNSRNKNTQIAAKKIVQKYKNISRKKAHLPFNTNDLAHAERIDFNNNFDISDVSSRKSTQIAAKKMVNKCKNLRKNKAPLCFIINAGTVDCNNNAIINDV